MIRSQGRGFTLIELMVVVAIVAIVAALALPSYQAHVLSAKRTEGQTALMNLAQRMERCFTEQTDFTDVSCPSGNSSSESGYYALQVSAAAGSYTLSATPTFDDQACGTLSLSHTGSRRADGSDCW